MSRYSHALPRANIFQSSRQITDPEFSVVEINEDEIVKKNKGTQVMDVPVESESPDTPKDGALQLYQPSSLPENRPIASTNLEISEIFAMAGKRPIESSHLVIRESMYESGIRPIAASDIEIFSMISISGQRPIGALDLHITATFSRNRPIASNNIDDVENLMGFLD